MPDWKFLNWPNRQDTSLNQDDLREADCEGLPVFFPDNETVVEIIFACTLPEFVMMLSALEKGAQLSYPYGWHNVWWNFVRQWECAVSICERVAECFSSQNESVMEALALALATNPLLIGAIADAVTQSGSATPGRSLSPGEATASFLPGNVKTTEGECIENALWGACLYLVQSGDRAIKDFFELTENASNTLEMSTAVAGAIPAAGPYAEAAGELADQILENFAEGYAAAYTEEFEQGLACEIFNIARENCELTFEQLVDVMAARMPDPTTWTTFEQVMVTLGSGVLVGPLVADAMFALYFGAVRFGQQFAGTLGIRPLTDLMSLGADQLASDNWQLLCEDDPQFVVEQFDVYAGGDPVDVQMLDYGEEYTFDSVVESGQPGSHILRLEFLPNVKVTFVSTTWSFVAGTVSTAQDWYDYSGSEYNEFWNAPGYGNNTTLPYRTIEDLPVSDYARIWVQNGAAFSVTLLIEPNV